MSYDVVLIPGDGIGPEVVEAAKRCVEATGVSVKWHFAKAGEEPLRLENTPLPDDTLKLIEKNKIALKGPVTTPVGKGFRSVNVKLRKELDLYACLRPCKSYKGVISRYDNIDLVVVRENTEDLYAGIEFQKGKDNTLELINFIKEKEKNFIKEDSGISIKPISESASKRIVDFAFQYAVSNGRKKVTAVHKANIMKFSDGLFLKSARDVALQYKDNIEFEDKIVDNMSMQLVQKPENFDVLVLPNLYGDIISDLCAGLVGGLGVTPGANIGKDIAVFEATHGSAPGYTGKNLVNPSAMILSAVMMLKYIGEKNASCILESAVAGVIEEGKHITYDLRPDRNKELASGTSEMADAVIKRVLKEK